MNCIIVVTSQNPMNDIIMVVTSLAVLQTHTAEELQGKPKEELLCMIADLKINQADLSSTGRTTSMTGEQTEHASEICVS
jgi:hypothetical protein